MNRMPVTPTKGNLLRLREEFLFTREGFKLLDEKKKVLISEIMKLIQEADESRKRFEVKVRDLLELFKKVVVFSGSTVVSTAGLACRGDYQLEVLDRSFMGVIYQTIKFSRDLKPRHSLTGTSPSFDDLQIFFQDFLQEMFRLIELESKLWRLGAELRKLMKRVNALENIFLPQYRETIKSIEETLEEVDREEYFLRKTLKRRTSGEQDRQENR